MELNLCISFVTLTTVTAETWKTAKRSEDGTVTSCLVSKKLFFWPVSLYELKRFASTSFSCAELALHDHWNDFLRKTEIYDLTLLNTEQSLLQLAETQQVVYHFWLLSIAGFFRQGLCYRRSRHSAWLCFSALFRVFRYCAVQTGHSKLWFREERNKGKRFITGMLHFTSLRSKWHPDLFNTAGAAEIHKASIGFPSVAMTPAPLPRTCLLGDVFKRRAIISLSSKQRHPFPVNGKSRLFRLCPSITLTSIPASGNLHETRKFVLFTQSWNWQKYIWNLNSQLWVDEKVGGTNIQRYLSSRFFCFFFFFDCFRPKKAISSMHTFCFLLLKCSTEHHLDVLYQIRIGTAADFILPRVLSCRVILICAWHNETTPVLVLCKTNSITRHEHNAFLFQKIISQR